MEFTAVIRKGEKFYVALCPELDVVSQGKTKKEALANLKEAVELYIEEMGVPEGASSDHATITRFAVTNGETA
jgi:predicted RNase H-like HicB family nuclease